MNSFNHYVLGAVVGFLYGRVAGIEPSAPGFARASIRPSIAVGFLRLFSLCPDGVRENLDKLGAGAPGQVTIEVEVLANVVASVYLPRDSRASNGGRQQFGGDFPGARRVTRSAQEVTVEVGTGP